MQFPLATAAKLAISIEPHLYEVAYTDTIS